MFWSDWVFHTSARNSMSTGIFPLKCLLLCKRSPSQNLWLQEKEIRLEPTHLSSAHHSDSQWISLFLIPGQQHLWRSVLAWNFAGAGPTPPSLLFLPPSFTALALRPSQALSWRTKSQKCSDWGRDTTRYLLRHQLPFCLLQSSQWLASTFSDRFLSFHFHPVYFHTALCCREDSEMFSEQKATSAFPLYSAKSSPWVTLCFP